MDEWLTRFWNNVAIGGPDDCWLWIGEVDRRGGYGRVCCRSQRNIPFRVTGENMAHRISSFLQDGPIPTGVWVRHRCDNPPCVNPSHLLRGTAKENSGDRTTRGRASSRVGVNNHNAFLSTKDVLQIRELSRLGMSRERVASMFHVTPSNITLIVTRKNWSHL